VADLAYCTHSYKQIPTCQHILCSVRKYGSFTLKLCTSCKGVGVGLGWYRMLGNDPGHFTLRWEEPTHTLPVGYTVSRSDVEKSPKFCNSAYCFQAWKVMFKQSGYEYICVCVCVCLCVRARFVLCIIIKYEGEVEKIVLHSMNLCEHSKNYTQRYIFCTRVRSPFFGAVYLA
jgi:hypothetical protein